MDLAGKRVLITGASRGLGRTLAFAFASAGAETVFAGARKPADIDSLQREADTAGLPVTAIRLDVRLEDDIRNLSVLGPVDILVNNAGVAGFGNPLTMRFEDIQEELEVNYLGAVRMARAIAPGMIERGSGVIVNVATAFAKVNLPLVGTYCATKAALLSLGQALRAHLMGTGVQVITVMPTTIDTDMSKNADVPKMTRDFVATEILKAIRDEVHDPAIGEEAKGLLAELSKDPVGLEKTLAQFK